MDDIVIEVTEEVIEIVVTPEVVEVEVADPDKVGPSGATIVSADVNVADRLELNMTDGRTIEVQGFTFPNGQATTGESNITLSAGRAVALDIDNKLIYADRLNPSTAYTFYGFTTTSGATGVGVLLSGVFTDVGLSLTPDEPVFLDTNGNFTQIPPTSGYLLIIGSAITTNKILIIKGTPIFLA